MFSVRLGAMARIEEPLPWGKSTATAAVLEQLVNDRLLPRNPNLARPVWILPRLEETEPNSPSGYIVSLVQLHERGFSVPVGRFMRALCDYYGVELHNFGLCEGYLGIEAHWDMLIHLFRGELFVENTRGQPKRYARAGGLMLHVRGNRPNLYIPC